jgi:hypothetical protein
VSSLPPNRRAATPNPWPIYLIGLGAAAVAGGVTPQILQSSDDSEVAANVLPEGSLAERDRDSRHH